MNTFKNTSDICLFKTYFYERSGHILIGRGKEREKKRKKELLRKDWHIQMMLLQCSEESNTETAAHISM